MRISQRARDAYADALAAEDPSYANIANSIRTGFENLWIRPGLAAIERLLREIPPEDMD